MNDMVIAGGAVLFFAVIVGLIFWGAWKAYTPRGFVFYLLFWCCLVTTGICALRSTWPSSAARRQADGIITWIVDHHSGRSHTYTLGFAPSSGGVLVLKAAAMPPFFAKGRDLVRVTYLEEKGTERDPRAIGFHVLTGSRAGYNDVVDADWLGPWLGVPLGLICGFAFLFAAYRNRRPKLERKEPGLSIMD